MENKKRRRGRRQRVGGGILRRFEPSVVPVVTQVTILQSWFALMQKLFEAKTSGQNKHEETT